MSARDPSYITHIYAILSERDLIRRHLSSPSSSTATASVLLPHLSTPSLAAAQHFYSIHRSKSHASSNRYPYDIFAYDRTSVKVRYSPKEGRDGEYLNANVVVGDNGGWWVASQAPIPSTIHPFFLALLTRSATSTYQSLHGIKPSTSTSTDGRHDSTHSHSPTSTTEGSTRKRKRKAAILVQLTEFVEQGRKKADIYLPSSKNPILRYEPPTTLRSLHPSLSISYHSSKQSHSLSSTISRFTLSTLSTPSPRFTSSPAARRTDSSGESRGQSWVESVSSKVNGSPVSQHQHGGERERQATSEEDEMELYHYHFVGWPDHGVPEGEDVHALKRLIEEVERKKEELKVENREEVEVWVHCSAGIGRTGTFIALSSLLHSIPSSSPPHSSQPTSMLVPLHPDVQRDRVARVVDLLREQRGMMVQTREQLELIYLISDGEMRGV